ncbi:MAG: tripartite tricarboxylate transporter substrate-binding protein [bacterium]
MKLTLRSITMIALPVLGAGGKIAVAQGYPAKPVHIIEPFGLGGGPDLLARALAPKLSELWGQPVTVENLPGAGATAGPARVAKSPADGYTLLLNTSAQAYSSTLKNLSYDPLKDFIPVAALTSQPYVLVAGKPAGVMSVSALIAATKARPGELEFGSTGAGTGTHLGIVTFNRDAGIRAVDVPPQPTDAIADILARTISGRITYMMAPISIALQPIRDGTLFPLGVTTLRRSTLLPEVPTIDEAGVKGFNFPIWYGIWAPAGTPVEVVNKLSKDITRVLAMPELRDWVAEHGGEQMRMSRADFAGFVQTESERAARLGAAAGIKPQ